MNGIPAGSNPSVANTDVQSQRPAKSTRLMWVGIFLLALLTLVGVVAGVCTSQVWSVRVFGLFGVAAAVSKLVSGVAKNYATDEKHVSEKAATNLTVMSQACDILAAVLAAPAIGSLVVKLLEGG